MTDPNLCADIPSQDLALGALFLAAKVEEHPRRIRDIVLVFDHVVKRARDVPLDPLEMFDTAFFELRNGLADGEMHILRALGFNIHVQHPHGIMVNYLQSLGLASRRDLCQRAWNYLNDQRVSSFFSYIRFSANRCTILPFQTANSSLGGLSCQHGGMCRNLARRPRDHLHVADYPALVGSL